MLRLYRGIHDWSSGISGLLFDTLSTMDIFYIKTRQEDISGYCRLVESFTKDEVDIYINFIEYGKYEIIASISLRLNIYSGC